MPLCDSQNYFPPFVFRFSHVSTIAPTLFRKVMGVNYQRHRLELPDGDFLDLDFSRVGSTTAVVITHGLEGHSQRAYVKGSVVMANNAGWDAVALNLRGCSGESNRLYGSYHSGRSDDLSCVVDYLINSNKYNNVFLVGFSLGGNITLKYMGEQGDNLPCQVKAAVGVSVPCDLAGSGDKLHLASNFIYQWRFLTSLKSKMVEKQKCYPHLPIDVEMIAQLKTLFDFDNRYTAPAHGFVNATDYYTKCSCKPLLSKIRVPSLMINALDDPFLPQSCYPVTEAEANGMFFLEMPASGGHVGFVPGYDWSGRFWHESRIESFFQSIIKG
jgi:hypothetical protein